MVLKQKTGKDHIDIITFYNELFIPIVKPLLVELAPAGNAKKSNQVSEATNNNGGNLTLQLFLKS